METIFDHDVTDDELVKLLGKAIDKEDYLKSYNGFVDGIGNRDFFFLRDLSNLYDSEVRGDRNKSLAYTQKMEKEHASTWSTYYNE